MLNDTLEHAQTLIKVHVALIIYSLIIQGLTCLRL